MHTIPPCYQTNNAVHIPIHTSGNPHNPVWGPSFFQPHSQGRRDRLKKESMNISLSGNSGSGDCRQEFWLAREDLQNVGSKPGGCLASRVGNLLQTSSSPSYPQHKVHFHSWGRGPEKNGGGKQRGRDGEVHCNTGHMKKKEGSWRKCKTAVTLSATMSSLLQKHATAKEPKHNQNSGLCIILLLRKGL